MLVARCAESLDSRRSVWSTRRPVTAEWWSASWPGETTDDAVAATRRLTDAGLTGHPRPSRRGHHRPAQAEPRSTRTWSCSPGSRTPGLTPTRPRSRSSSPRSARRCRGDGEQIALENAHAICAAAERAGTTVTLDMEDHTTTDSTLRILRELREDFPATGAVLQAYLHRTEADCRDLAYGGLPGPAVQGRVRGAGVRRVSRTEHEVDQSYVRCLHDPDGRRGLPDGRHPRPAAGRDRADRAGRELTAPTDTFEFQMLYGIRPARAAAAGRARATRCGSTCRTATDWYGYLVRRLAERPANLAFFLRALVDAVVSAGSRSSAPARWARRCCPGCCAPVARPTTCGRRAPRRAGRAELPERYGVEVVDNAEAAEAPTR